MFLVYFYSYLTDAFNSELSFEADFCVEDVVLDTTENRHVTRYPSAVVDVHLKVQTHWSF